MLYHLDYKHIGYVLCESSDFQDREDFINSYNCPYKADTLGYFNTGDILKGFDVLEDINNHFINCENNTYWKEDLEYKFIPEKEYRYAFDSKERMNMQLKQSITERLRLLKDKRLQSKKPFDTNYKLWQKSITERYNNSYVLNKNNR